jgi:hypothetical protein
MKSLFVLLFVLMVVFSASSVQAQVWATYYAPAPYLYAPAPVLVAPPPVPVVTYYQAPLVTYTPGFYAGPAPVYYAPAPVYVRPRGYTVRTRVYVRGQPVRNALRVLAP